MQLRASSRIPGRYREEAIPELPGVAKFVHPTIPFNPNLPPAAFPTLDFPLPIRQQIDDTTEEMRSATSPRKVHGAIKSNHQGAQKRATVFHDSRPTPSRAAHRSRAEQNGQIQGIWKGGLEPGEFMNENMFGSDDEDSEEAHQPIQGLKAYEIYPHWDDLKDSIKMVVMMELTGTFHADEAVRLLRLTDSEINDFIDLQEREEQREEEEMAAMARITACSIDRVALYGASAAEDFSEWFDEQCAQIPPPITFSNSDADLKVAKRYLNGLGLDDLAPNIRDHRGIDIEPMARLNGRQPEPLAEENISEEQGDEEEPEAARQSVEEPLQRARVNTDRPVPPTRKLQAPNPKLQDVAKPKKHSHLKPPAQKETKQSNLRYSTSADYGESSSSPSPEPPKRAQPPSYRAQQGQRQPAPRPALPTDVLMSRKERRSYTPIRLHKQWAVWPPKENSPVQAQRRCHEAQQTTLTDAGFRPGLAGPGNSQTPRNGTMPENYPNSGMRPGTMGNLYNQNQKRCNEEDEGTSVHNKRPRIETPFNNIQAATMNGGRSPGTPTAQMQRQPGNIQPSRLPSAEIRRGPSGGKEFQQLNWMEQQQQLIMANLQNLSQTPMGSTGQTQPSGSAPCQYNQRNVVDSQQPNGRGGMPDSLFTRANAFMNDGNEYGYAQHRNPPNAQTTQNGGLRTSTGQRGSGIFPPERSKSFPIAQERSGTFPLQRTNSDPHPRPRESYGEPNGPGFKMGSHSSNNMLPSTNWKPSSTGDTLFINKGTMEELTRDLPQQRLIQNSNLAPPQNNQAKGHAHAQFTSPELAEKWDKSLQKTAEKTGNGLPMPSHIPQQYSVPDGEAPAARPVFRNGSQEIGQSRKRARSPERQIPSEEQARKKRGPYKKKDLTDLTQEGNASVSYDVSGKDMESGRIDAMNGRSTAKLPASENKQDTAVLKKNRAPEVKKKKELVDSLKTESANTGSDAPALENGQITIPAKKKRPSGKKKQKGEIDSKKAAPAQSILTPQPTPEAIDMAKQVNHKPSESAKETSMNQNERC